jgi:hypothetical protein
MEAWVMEAWEKVLVLHQYLGKMPTSTLFLRYRMDYYHPQWCIYRQCQRVIPQCKLRSLQVPICYICTFQLTQQVRMLVAELAEARELV